MGRINCVCIDASENSEKAFNWYLKNYHRSDDVVALIHVIQSPQLPSMGLTGGSIPISNEMHSTIKNAQETSEKLVAKYKDICVQHNAEFKVLVSDTHHQPGEVICQLSKENKGEVIVLGQRGLSPFSRAILGSTSDHILHKAEVPVIVVPPIN